MVSTVLFLLGFLASSQAAMIPQYSRIVHGDAKLGDLPWQAFVRFSNIQCGGAVINAYYILTAAHCTLGQRIGAIGTIITAGVVHLDFQVRNYGAKRIIIHPEYDPEDHLNDISLIEVIYPMNDSKYIKPVALPRGNQEIMPGSRAIVAGWGSFRADGLMNDRMQMINVYIISNKECQRYYGPIYNTQICANEPPNDSDTCQLDFGSPVTVNGTLVGLISAVTKCGKTYYPNVETRITSFADWICYNAR